MPFTNIDHAFDAAPKASIEDMTDLLVTIFEATHYKSHYQSEEFKECQEISLGISITVQRYTFIYGHSCHKMFVLVAQTAKGDSVKTLVRPKQLQPTPLSTD